MANNQKNSGEKNQWDGSQFDDYLSEYSPKGDDFGSESWLEFSPFESDPEEDFSASSGDTRQFPGVFSGERGFELISGKKLDNNGYAIPEEGDTRDPETERDYRPVRMRRDRRFGCMGGVMFAVFIISVSIILTCLGWMAANDVLALNKPELEAVIEVPKTIFSDKEIQVSVKDDEGNVIGTEPKTVKAADIDYIAKLLKENGLIEYEFLFKFYARYSKADLKIDPGTYTLSTSFDYRALITKMHAGSESQVRTKLTFPEGYTVQKIFSVLDENDICSYDSLMEAARNINFNYSFLKDIPLGDASRLEGYLFPDTYDFYQGMAARSVISKFLDNFKNRITREMLDQVEKRGITLRDALNVASMIEKEAAVITEGETARDDRKDIAGVIYNRLRVGMYLGIDATSYYSHPELYGIKNGLTAEILYDENDMYATRVHLGLPPTPICNPGIAAISAAIFPPDSANYYYALDTATGLHKFFRNANDFNNFVATQNYG